MEYCETIKNDKNFSPSPYLVELNHIELKYDCITCPLPFPPPDPPSNSFLVFSRHISKSNSGFYVLLLNSLSCSTDI